MYKYQKAIIREDPEGKLKIHPAIQGKTVWVRIGPPEPVACQSLLGGMSTRIVYETDMRGWCGPREVIAAESVELVNGFSETQPYANMEDWIFGETGLTMEEFIAEGERANDAARSTRPVGQDA